MNDYHFPLMRREEIASGTFAIWLDTRGSDFIFKPGQWVDLTLVNAPLRDELGNTRTFSIASSPSLGNTRDLRHQRDQLMFVMRSGKSAFKRNLWEISLGTPIQISPATGSFVLPSSIERPIVFFAGGIGITPMKSMIEWIVREQTGHRVYLFYSNRTPGESAFLDEFLGWSKKIHLHIIPTVTDIGFDPSWKHERGRIDRVMIERHLKGVNDALYYIAGPPSFTLSIWQLLYGMGITDDAIRTEEFSGYLN